MPDTIHPQQAAVKPFLDAGQLEPLAPRRFLAGINFDQPPASIMLIAGQHQGKPNIAGPAAPDWDEVQQEIDAAPRHLKGNKPANAYFTIGQPFIRGHNRRNPKWGLKDMDTIPGCWVEYDPPTDIWPEHATLNDLNPAQLDAFFAWREAVLADLLEQQDTMPAPHAVMDSGRGFWGFWRFAEHYRLDLPESVTSKTASIPPLDMLRAFHPNSDTSVLEPSRIVRLPGTPNLKTGWIAQGYKVLPESEPFTLEELNYLASRAAELTEGKETGNKPVDAGKPTKERKPDKRPAFHKTANGLSDLLKTDGIQIVFDRRNEAHFVKSELAAEANRQWLKDTLDIADFNINGDGWGRVDDRVERRLRNYISENYQAIKQGETEASGSWRVTAAAWDEMLASVAPSVDFFHIWLTALPAWDGTDRFLPLFRNCLGVMEHTPNYLQLLAQTLLASIVARAFVPGCPADLVITLVGPEGYGKSRFFQLLFPNDWQRFWFNDSLTLGMEGRQLLETLAGCVVGEIPEFNDRNRSTAAIKAAITRNVDRGRRAYGRNAQYRGRDYVMVSTANDLTQSGILNELQENRRFGMVNLPARGDKPTEDWVAFLQRQNRLMTDWFEQNRRQLWAQALNFYWSAPPENAHWLMPAEMQAEQRNTAAANDAGKDSEEALKNALTFHFSTVGPGKPLTMTRIIRQLGLLNTVNEEMLSPSAVAAKMSEGFGKRAAMRLAKVLADNGWRKKRQTLYGGQEAVYWHHPLCQCDGCLPDTGKNFQDEKEEW